MNFKSQMAQSVVDALGFLAGSGIAFFLSRQFGFDLFAQGYGSSSMVAILMCGLGGGLGVASARRLYERFK
jgi:hypothetical protein